MISQEDFDTLMGRAGGPFHAIAIGDQIFSGITLRDWYKGQALAAFDIESHLDDGGRAFTPKDAELFASVAGMLADAMIAEGKAAFISTTGDNPK